MSLEGQARLSPRLVAIADALSETLSEIAGEKVLFALCLFGSGDDGRGQYIANCDRQGVKKVLTALLEQWKETGGDDGPYHVFHKAH